MKTHVLGFPRIGAKRELKKALEAFWRGERTESQLKECCSQLRLHHWKIQNESGLSYVCTGDFSMYDHVLDTTLMLGGVPSRFSNLDVHCVETYFKMARGDQKSNLLPMEMTKWFNTNYHYIVPEISATFEPKLANKKIINETQEALSAGFNPKAVLLGPITYLSLCKGENGFNCWEKLDAVVDVYVQVIEQLSDKCEWIELDEPILCSDLPKEGRLAFSRVYQRLNAAAKNSKILLATYFDNLDENLDLALASHCAGIHLDLVRGGDNLDLILKQMPEKMILSAGVVEGRNIWKNDFSKSHALIRKIQNHLGERVMISSSCSLQHSPVDLSLETKLDSVLKSWLSFAVQKCEEVAFLASLDNDSIHSEQLKENQKTVESRQNSKRIHNEVIKNKVALISSEMYHRKNTFSTRQIAQKQLNLPLFPTTTIGSFPQTLEIRNKRKSFKNGELTQCQYDTFLKSQIAEVVKCQETLELDVFVHGEAERNDMVEYFGQQLNGFCFTENGWVQSYGSRCVKPPIIFGDISRPKPMTINWITYAQSLTKKPMKGMLTGPVTILCWSFVRDDKPLSEVCTQIALAIRDEVYDLEQAGIKIIQIDEAALSEGLPIKNQDHAHYLQWAINAFRLSTSCVEDTTQIHTHMCYSEFNKMIEPIASMDADVISIEASRSHMELLQAFKNFEYPNEVGPGVYDIHSPRIPTQKEIFENLKKACQYIPKERLWVNPDCGLKTRQWHEVILSLQNMVSAAKELRLSQQ